MTDKKNLLLNFAIQSSRGDSQATPEPVTSSHRGGGDPGHVAAIMDGNGRWARRRGLPRTAGHRAGARSVRATIEAASELGIDVLSLYAFSSNNWQRPQHEVDALMDLLERYLAGEAERCVENGVRIAIIGRRDRLRPSLLRAIESTEAATMQGSRLLVRLAVDYSSRWAILRAARQTRALDPPTFEAGLLEAISSPREVGAVDLLIRTGGEQRLSDFLLWECAYAELYFSSCLWPDFGKGALATAVEDYHRRERRYGRVPKTRAAHHIAKGV